MEMAPATHHVTLDDTSQDKIDHLTLTIESGVYDYKAGDEVDVYCNTAGQDGSDYVGWLPTGTPYDFNSLNDRVYSNCGQNINPYTFTMPDEDVTVYAVCQGGPHEVA